MRSNDLSRPQLISIVASLRKRLETIKKTATDLVEGVNPDPGQPKHGDAILFAAELGLAESDFDVAIDDMPSQALPSELQSKLSQVPAPTIPTDGPPDMSPKNDNFQCIGLTVPEFQAMTGGTACFRIKAETINGVTKRHMGTADFRPERFNLYLVDGRIAKVTFG